MKRYISLKEKRQIKERKAFLQRYVPCKFTEELTLSDLNKNQGISDYAKKFRKGTTKYLGRSTNVVKLVDAELDVKKDWITYYFLTEYTPFYDPPEEDEEPIPNKNPQEVEPPSMDLTATKTYEIHVRIMNIMKWLDTYDKNYPIKRQDLKDILEVASIQWWSSVPSFQYQGSNYIMSMFDASIYPEIRPDEYWKQYHKSDNFLDKHSVGIANTILSFWINPMVQMLNSRLKKLKK